MKEFIRSDYRDRVAEEAAIWYARLQDTESRVADREAFAQWLRASAENVREYLALAALHTDLSELERVSSKGELLDLARSAESRNVIALASSPVSEAGRAQAFRRKRPRWRYLVTAASIALVAMVAFQLLPDPNRAQYVTQRGEQKSIALPDGSVVTLNALSDVTLAFTPRSRDIRLASGEALFDVAKNPRRPFRVLTDDAVIRAVGTRFNVYHRERDTTVTVVEGVVAVASPAKPAVVLRSRQRARIEPQTGSIAVAATNPETDTAWRERRLIFESRPLGAVVAEFNLYNDARLVIEDPVLAKLEVSGNFYANDPHSFAQFLEEAKLAAPRDRADGTIELGSPKKVVVDSSN